MSRQIIVRREDGELVHVAISDAQRSRRAVERALTNSGCRAGRLETVISHEGDDDFVQVVLDLFPGATPSDINPLDADGQRVNARTTVSITPRFYRTIAKIAFHYLLAEFGDEFVGDEPEFAGIREFVRNGVGDPSAFVARNENHAIVQFAEGRRPRYWMHVLALFLDRNEILAHVQLFAGPEHIDAGFTVRIGQNPYDTWAGRKIRSHQFVIGAPETPPGFDGIMVDSRPIHRVVIPQRFGLVRGS